MAAALRSPDHDIYRLVLGIDGGNEVDVHRIPCLVRSHSVNEIAERLAEDLGQIRIALQHRLGKGFRLFGRDVRREGRDIRIRHRLDDDGAVGAASQALAIFSGWSTRIPFSPMISA